MASWNKEGIVDIQEENDSEKERHWRGKNGFANVCGGVLCGVVHFVHLQG